MKIIKKHSDHIYIYYDEVFKRIDLINLMKEARAICMKEDCKKLLVNLQKMPGSLSTMDRFELGIQGALIFHNTVRIAVVYRKEEINRFAETVGLNRGMVIGVFGSLEDAKAWLNPKAEN